MSEKGLWSTMRVQMGSNKYWREATRHEDSLQKGIADVSFVANNGYHGWIELKKIKEWPKRESTIVRIEHYTDDQRIWLKQKGRAGGCTWLFLQVGRDYMLFNWKAAQEVGRLPKQQLMRSASLVSEKGMDWAELGRVLQFPF
jgi:hypothetical protein